MMKKTYIYFLILTLLSCVACSDDEEKQGSIGYSGKDISSQVEIVRDAETKKAVLNVTGGGAWTLYAGVTAAQIDIDNPLLQGSGQGSFDLDVDDLKRYIFQFRTDEGQVIVSEKRLPIAGGYNFRDIGGLKNKDGKFVQWGRLFRGDEMSKLTDDDLAYVASTGLKTVVDFRSDSEKEGGLGGMIPPAPNKLASSVENTYNMPINSGNIFSDEIMSQIRAGATQEELMQVMVDSYTEMVSNDAYVAVFKQLFDHIQNGDNLPLLFHCSAGKDRTGVATMLILSALDVDKEIIMQDYLLSKQYIAGKYDRYLAVYPSIAPLVTIEREYLEATYDKINEKYGSVKEFLTGTLNVDIEKMKNLYLY